MFKDRERQRKIGIQFVWKKKIILQNHVLRRPMILGWTLNVLLLPLPPYWRYIDIVFANFAIFLKNGAYDIYKILQKKRIIVSSSVQNLRPVLWFSRYLHFSNCSGVMPLIIIIIILITAKILFFCFFQFFNCLFCDTGDQSMFTCYILFKKFISAMKGIANCELWNAIQKQPFNIFY